MHEKLESQLASLDPVLQVDVLWALCVLQQAREAELQAVLHPDFHTLFLGEQRSVPPAWVEPIPTSIAELACWGAAAWQRWGCGGGRPGRPHVCSSILSLR